MKTVVVYGGVFDPPHYYHTVGPLAITMKLFGEEAWLLYVPAAKSPFKLSGPGASDRQRLAMLKLALDIPGRRSIWTDEIDRVRRQRSSAGEEPSFTVDSLTRLKKVLPRGTKLRLLIGSDQAAAFHKWKDCRAVIALAKPLVMAREPVVTVNQLYQSLDSDFWTRRERGQWCEWMAPNFPMPAASSSIRERIPFAPRIAEEWQHDDDLSMVTTPVAEYIVKHKLYGFGSKKAARPRSTPLAPEDRALADILGEAARMATRAADPKRFPRRAVTRLKRKRQ